MIDERDIRIIVSENVKRYMEDGKMNKQKLGNVIGFRSLELILSGKGSSGCSISTLQKVAMALEVNTIDLIEDWSE